MMILAKISKHVAHNRNFNKPATTSSEIANEKVREMGEKTRELLSRRVFLIRISTVWWTVVRLRAAAMAANSIKLSNLDMTNICAYH